VKRTNRWKGVSEKARSERVKIMAEKKETWERATIKHESLRISAHGKPQTGRGRGDVVGKIRDTENIFAID